VEVLRKGINIEELHTLGLSALRPAKEQFAANSTSLHVFIRSGNDDMSAKRSARALTP
jgi:hypothetical protein